MKLTNSERELRRDTIGQTLREHRLHAGLTQWDVARGLRYSTAQFVSNWERGLSLPPLESLPPLAEMLGIPAKEMIELFYDYERRIMELGRRRMAEAFRAAGRD